MWSGLNLHLRHDLVAHDAGDEAAESVSGRHMVGVVARLITEFESEPGQFGARDLPMASVGASGLQAPLVGPTPHRVGAHTQKSGGFPHSKLVHTGEEYRKTCECENCILIHRPIVGWP